MLSFYPKDTASNIALYVCDCGHKTVLQRICMSTSRSPEATSTWTEMKWSMNIKLNMCIDDPGHSCVRTCVSPAGDHKEQ